MDAEATAVIKKNSKNNNIKGCPFTTIPAFPGIAFDATLAFNGSFCVADNQEVVKFLH